MTLLGERHAQAPAAGQARNAPAPDAAAGAERLKLFVSYSRRDMDAAGPQRRLHLGCRLRDAVLAQRRVHHSVTHQEEGGQLQGVLSPGRGNRVQLRTAGCRKRREHRDRQSGGLEAHAPQVGSLNKAFWRPGRFAADCVRPTPLIRERPASYCAAARIRVRVSFMIRLHSANSSRASISRGRRRASLSYLRWTGQSVPGHHLRQTLYPAPCSRACNTVVISAAFLA